MTNIRLLHEISATFVNICINLMQISQKYARKLCKIFVLEVDEIDFVGGAGDGGVEPFEVIGG